MSSNLALLWSFEDTLYPKLILNAPRELVYLSFCPYDENVLIGGMITGQLVIWDLENHLHRAENSTSLSDRQEKSRAKMHSLMRWSKIFSENQQNFIQPVAFTPIELSHKKVITSIKWLNRKHCVASTGLIQESLKPNELFRQFVTASLDGTISFWDLDYINPNEAKTAKRKTSLFNFGSENVSPYAKLNGVIRPIYTISYDRPITSLIFDEGRFSKEPKIAGRNINVETRVEHTVIYEAQEKTTNKLIVSTLLGQVEAFVWEGFLCKEGKPEFIKQTDIFGGIHNGPVLSIHRNPSAIDIFLSIGQNIFAIWSESNQTTPILWRRRESAISCGQWSTSNASLFFIGCHDGTIELWDVLIRTDDPSISHSLGMTNLTIISQHMLSLPIDVLLVGDKKGNLRAFSIPSSISRPTQCRLSKLRSFIDNELVRKKKFNQWQEKYSEKNEDLRETKQLLREESRKTIEQQDKDYREHSANKSRTSADKKSKPFSKLRKPKLVYDLPQHLNQKWKAMNVKRLMKTLLTLKQFDPELIAIRIKPERDRLAYNEKKKKAIENSFSRIHEEISELRARLIPPRDIDQDLERLKFIYQNVENMFSSGVEGFSFDQMKSEMKTKIDEFKKCTIDIKWHDVLERAQQRRSKLNKSIFAKKRNEYRQERRLVEKK